MYPTTTGTGGADIAPADGRSIYSRADNANSGGYAAAAYWTASAPQPMYTKGSNKRMPASAAYPMHGGAHPMAPAGPYALPTAGMRYNMAAPAPYAYGGASHAEHKKNAQWRPDAYSASSSGDLAPKPAWDMDSMQGSGAAHWDGYQYTYMPPGSGGHNAMAHAHRGPAAMTGGPSLHRPYAYGPRPSAPYHGPHPTPYPASTKPISPAKSPKRTKATDPASADTADADARQLAVEALLALGDLVQPKPIVQGKPRKLESVASGGLVVVKNENVANSGTFPTPPMTPPVAKAGLPGDAPASSSNNGIHAGEASETAQRQAVPRTALPEDTAGLVRRPEVENEDEKAAHKRPKIESQEVSVAA